MFQSKKGITRYYKHKIKRKKTHKNSKILKYGDRDRLTFYDKITKILKYKNTEQKQRFGTISNPPRLKQLSQELARAVALLSLP